MRLDVSVRPIVKSPPPRSYPWLGKRDGVYVLFTSVDTGTVIQSDERRTPVGFHSENWNIRQFEEVSGEEIVIKQVH